MLNEATLILIVGLGNPGPQYENNRHNIGFMAVDKIAERHSFPPFKAKEKNLISEGRIGSKKVILIKPMDFMNRSGRAMSPIANFYKIPPEHVIVIHDELDLAAGKVRVKQGGGAGGHNGIRDLDAHFGKDTWRVRLGVGHPGHRDKVTSHVLNDFSKQDKEWLDFLLVAVADEIGYLVEGDKDRFMTNVAQTMQN